MDILSWICHNFYLHHHLTKQLGKEPACTGSHTHPHFDAHMNEHGDSKSTGQPHAQTQTVMQQNSNSKSSALMIITVAVCLAAWRGESWISEESSACSEVASGPGQTGGRKFLQSCSWRSALLAQRSDETKRSDNRAAALDLTAASSIITADQRMDSHFRFSVIHKVTASEWWLKS